MIQVLYKLFSTSLFVASSPHSLMLTEAAWFITGPLWKLLVTSGTKHS